ncbi:MAG: helix-turn-helix transcriptional regulator [Clostridiales bacterium]|nr:helix-turn-helix transcriptional regulator [Clostridiales bacterium]
MKYSGEILRGNTETIILAILKEKDSYGYEIMKTIIDGSEGLFNIKDATIYTAFKRMERDGLITGYWGDKEGGARRKYYRISEKGRDFYAQKVEEWKRVNIILNNLINGSGSL